MTPLSIHRPSLILRLLISASLFIMMMSLPASALDPETCFSRQHQGVTVNVRQALSRAAAAMNPRLVRSERDCVLACCSEEVQPGSRCNMVVFKAVQHTNDENCLLFHCPTELDCPLMKAEDGINTYNIYKGLTHPPTPRPVAMTTTVQTTTGTTPSTTVQTTTSTTPSTTVQTTSGTTPSTTVHTTTGTTPSTTVHTTSGTTPSTTVHTTTGTTPSTTVHTTTTSALATHPTTTQAPPTTTGSPQSSIFITSMPASPSPLTTPTPTTTPTTTRNGFAPAFDLKKPNKSSKKQNKPTKKGKPHPVSTISTTQPPPSSTRSLPVQTVGKGAEPRTLDTTQSHTETTTTPPTTTSAPPPTQWSTTTTTASPSLIIIPKDIFQSDHVLQSGHALQNSSTSQTKVAQGALKSGVVAFMVLGLAVLILALAVGGRKAMESFDRRHYTRLELNDLHYEI
ncbi:MANSC domain-containing protein 1 [Nematolebias whitei]|uniref:MANSC domain-containing protein 1 n=1 Tax=Nematolebias whitei TaxID=451745 RepID=UPI00189A9751|nr:MANSC domain-containing protein 1 [Nematolebias whitei]